MFKKFWKWFWPPMDEIQGYVPQRRRIYPNKLLIEEHVMPATKLFIVSKHLRREEQRKFQEMLGPDWLVAKHQDELLDSGPFLGIVRHRDFWSEVKTLDWVNELHTRTDPACEFIQL